MLSASALTICGMRRWWQATKRGAGDDNVCTPSRFDPHVMAGVPTRSRPPGAERGTSGAPGRRSWPPDRPVPGRLEDVQKVLTNRRHRP